MNEQEILQKILERTRLSTEDLKSFFKKFNDFVNNLSAGERQLLLGSLKAPHTAAAELLAETSAERLQNALRSQVPEGMLIFCCTLPPKPPAPPEPLPPTQPKE